VFRKRLDEITAQTDAEKEWWGKRRDAIQSGFMKELDSSNAEGSVGGDAVMVESSGAPSTPGGGGKKKKGKK
jgi:translocation protein SEC66